MNEIARSRLDNRRRMRPTQTPDTISFVTEKAFAYRDAVGAYNVQVDLALKYFTFLQVVGAGTIGLVVSGSPNMADRVMIGLVFLLFAGGNAFLLHRVYTAAVALAEAMRRYREKHSDEFAPEFNVEFKSFQPYPAWQLVLVHFFVDSVVLVIIGVA
jgi:hypothetical protein